MSALILVPGDILLTRGTGFFSAAIRFFSRSWCEAPTLVNHAGLVVVVGGSLYEAVVVESQMKVAVRRRLWAAYGPPSQDAVAIFVSPCGSDRSD